MKGSILNYSIQNQTGEILGDNQEVYTFTSEQWSEHHTPAIGEHVHFKLDTNDLIAQVTSLLSARSQTPIPFSPPVNQTKNSSKSETDYNMIDWFIKCLKNYANFTGRARRKEFWFFSLIQFIVIIFAFILDYILGTYLIIYIISFLALIIPNYAVLVRRLHDINMSGWSMFISMIPIIGGIILLVWLCTETKFEDNQWGKPAK